MHMLVGSCPGSPSFSWKTLVSQVLWARWLYGQCCKELFAASLMARDMGHGKNPSWLMSSGITRTIFEENHNPCGETLLLTNQDSYKGRTLDFEQRSCHMICFHMKGGGSQSSHVRTPSRRNPIPFGGMSISATKKHVLTTLHMVYCTYRTIWQYHTIIYTICIYTTDLLYVFVCALISETEQTDVWSSLQ